jgi:hypothetical protein
MVEVLDKYISLIKFPVISFIRKARNHMDANVSLKSPTKICFTGMMLFENNKMICYYYRYDKQIQSKECISEIKKLLKYEIVEFKGLIGLCEQNWDEYSWAS